jgi:hypothetical protein
MDVAKQRVRLHIKLLQQIGSPAAVGGGMTTGINVFCFDVFLFLTL